MNPEKRHRQGSPARCFEAGVKTDRMRKSEIITAGADTFAVFCVEKWYPYTKAVAQ